MLDLGGGLRVASARSKVIAELNDRPRKRLGFYKPTEKIADLLLQ